MEKSIASAASRWLLAFAVILCQGCVLWNRLTAPTPPQVPVEDDKSIRFPSFFEHTAITLGTQGEVYELDGVTLRAIMIAANNFIPPSSSVRSCPDRQESHRYRVVRQGNIVFVYIHEDPAACGESYLALDSGAKYAISADGRILRRVLDGQPEEPLGLEVLDGGPRGVPSKPGVPPGYDDIWNKPANKAEEQDGGISHSRQESIPEPSPNNPGDGGV